MSDTKLSYTIPYDQPIVDLIDKVNEAGHVTHKTFKKKSVTLHRNSGNLIHEGAVIAWRSRGVSAHFDIDIFGRIAQGVIVNEYAWAVGQNVGNEESIHIDLANRTLGPRWEISEDTLRSTARLIAWLFVYEINDHPSRDNVLTHDHWSQVDCPGRFIESIFDEFLEEIQGWYERFRSEQKTPATFDVRTETSDAVDRIVTIQMAVGVEPTGEWDSDTDQAVLEFRRKHRR